MIDKTKDSPRNGDNAVPNEHENCVDDGIPIENKLSTEETDQTATEVFKPQKSFEAAEMVSGREGTVSVETNTNASANTASLDSTIAGSSGPPSNIIPQFDDVSEQIINLDSIQDSEKESDESDMNGIIAKRDDNKTSWLNIDSSSTSQGSQGSYAHQVPNLLGSYGSNGAEVNQQLLPPPPHPFPEMEHSEDSRSSNLQTLDNPQNSNLSDILGPKGLPIGPDGEPLESDLDDILGPQTSNKLSDLDDTLGPYDGSVIGSSRVPSKGQRDVTPQAPGNQLTTGSSVKTKGDGPITEKEYPMVQIQQLLSVSKDSLESKPTLEFVRNAYGQTTNKSITTSSGSHHGETVVKKTNLGANAIYSNCQSTDVETIRSTSQTPRIDSFSRGDQSSKTGVTAPSQENIRAEHTTGTSNSMHCIDESEGGRMWREAQIEAANSKDKPLSPRAKKFAESIMARTRSRADPNILSNSPSNIEVSEKPTRNMVNVNNQEEGAFIRGTSTAIAKKRGRTVLLLTIGLLSFLIAFLGGILVLSSCFFVSATIDVGDYGEEYELHFGLWKYSPVESASKGYNYCSEYDGDFIAGAPWFGRISSLVAIVGGGFSLCVLWLYLILGRSVKNTWDLAVYAAIVSGILQLSTLSIFTGPICQEKVCNLGPAGVISIAAGCFYFVLAFEMYYNTPLFYKKGRLTTDITCCEEPHQIVSNLEMTDFEYGAKAYAKRIMFGVTNPYTTTQNQGHIGKSVKSDGSPSYVPPIV